MLDNIFQFRIGYGKIGKFRKSNFFHKSKYLRALLRFSFGFAAVEHNLVPSKAILSDLIFLGAGKLKSRYFGEERAIEKKGIKKKKYILYRMPFA